jgi:toxin ParE1/3/4
MLRFARSAESDLLEAWLFIAEENLTAADRLLDQIDREIATLLLQPLMGRTRPELAVDLRSWPTSTSYVLFYMVDTENLTVIRVLHHARDIRQLGFDG